MNFPNWADHILVIIFCILLPLQAIRQHRKNTSQVEYNSKQKLAIYLSASISLFIMATIIVAVWLLFRRSLEEIGLTLKIEGRMWIWTVLAFITVYAADTIYSVATAKNITVTKNEWQKRTPFMPTKRKELPGYILMCLCAGIFEEIVYRGYLVTYFESLFNSLLLSVIVPAFAFSVSHFYHGPKNIIKIFLLSTFLGFIFIQSGSLVIVMILHFIINVIGGLLSVRYMRQS